jgi:hypothetical protein
VQIWQVYGLEPVVKPIDTDHLLTVACPKQLVRPLSHRLENGITFDGLVTVLSRKDGWQCGKWSIIAFVFYLAINALTTVSLIAPFKGDVFGVTCVTGPLHHAGLALVISKHRACAT